MVLNLNLSLPGHREMLTKRIFESFKRPFDANRALATDIRSGCHYDIVDLE